MCVYKYLLNYMFAIESDVEKCSIVMKYLVLSQKQRSSLSQVVYCVFDVICKISP